MVDWDDAFANGAYIDEAEAFPPAWAAAAAAYRAAAARARLDLPYDTTPRTRYDLFLPTATPRGLVVFVHGGYWLKFDKSTWSHLAAGAVAAGWAVALPGYTLAPAARISEITAQIGRAITAASAEIAGPIMLAGHSAGGHLVTRMACASAPLEPEVQGRLAHVLSLSGLHDLRPLRATQMNAQLRLSADEAARESPALLDPVAGLPVTAWVGGHERPEFLRQSALLREAWARKGAEVRLVVDAGLHHFNVIDGLTRPDSALTRSLLGQSAL